MFSQPNNQSAILISLLGTIITTSIFQDIRSGIISGLVIGFFSHIQALHNRFSRKNRRALSGAKALAENYADLLNINNKFLLDDWLFNELRRITESHNTAAQEHSYLLKLVRDEITQGINEAQATLKGRRKEYLGAEMEMKRQEKLTDMIGKSKESIRAVTSFNPVYWKTFWGNSNISEEYIEANICAARRGVKIDRIFLLPNSVLDGTDQENSKAVSAIMQSMVGQHDNLQIKCFSTDGMPEGIAHHQDAGFLVMDELCVAVSYSPSQLELPYKEGGYIAIASDSEVGRALDSFNTLNRFAQPAESFPFFPKKTRGTPAQPSTPPRT